MRNAAVASCLVSLVLACSSSDEGVECPIVGTYSMTGEVESTTCVFPETDNEPTSTLVSIEAADPDSEYDFYYSFQGATGQCGLKRVSACKVEGTCPFRFTDATTSNDEGAIQASWTFNSGGFSGVTALTAPPVKDNPNGCVQTARNTATRR